ncbi:MAG: hypothetical protein H6974_02680 [Gammaproteobacteria bacterium]|nr:hypothetical protein [Gammaproteobacteria bacterium]MCP5195688.1 hypothetical protein [Gammaproteobacteria bacterium]
MENIDDWSLDLASGTWSRIVHRAWPRWVIFRSDKRANRLWEIRQALWDLTVGWEDSYKKAVGRLEEALGFLPDVRAVEQLFRPDVAHDVLPGLKEEYGVYRIRLEGVTIRFVEEHHCIWLTIEGCLPQALAERLVEGVRRKVAALEGTEYGAEKIA